jgi:hypothetical protein
MGHTEDHSMLDVLIASSVTHGTIGMLGVGLWLYMWTQLKKVMSSDSKEQACAKIAYRHQRQMAGLAGLANLLIAVVLAAMIMKMGTQRREADNHKVNWSYFAIAEAGAFALLAIAASIFYWFASALNAILLGGMWAIWCVLFGVASLNSGFNARLMLFIISVCIQCGSIAFLWFASHTTEGMLTVLRGILPAGVLALCLVVYDTVWYVGYLNRPHPRLDINTRWEVQLALFITAAVAHVVVPLIWGYFYEPKKADVDYERSMAAVIGAELPAVESAQQVQYAGLPSN